MNLLFELSKEHETLPKAEVLACLQTEQVQYEIVEATDDVLLIETNIQKNVIERLAERLSLTYFIDKLLFSCDHSLEEIKKFAIENSIVEKGTLAIQYKNRSKIIDSKPIIETLGEIYTKNRTVDLTNPEVMIRVLITDSRVYVGLKIVEIDRKQFEKRKVQFRPFFSPISLHPKLARTLVNLSQVCRDETLLDPFCGTGGILLEAGLIGAKVVGSDIEERMIDGCRKTFDFYKIKNYELFCSDIGFIQKKIDVVDAVVTDLPYGKSTTTKGEEIKELYDRSFENICKILKKGRRAVIGISNKEMISFGERYFSLIDVQEFRVHSSLTRYFTVFQK